MNPVSRRTFFKSAGAAASVVAVAGSTLAGPLGLNGGVAGAATIDAPLTPEEDLRTNEELVVHVKNTRSGEISLFVGHREVIIHDRKMAARLVRATR